MGYAQDFKNRVNDVYARLNEQFENTAEETPYQKLVKETVRRSGAPFCRRLMITARSGCRRHSSWGTVCIPRMKKTMPSRYSRA